MKVISTETGYINKNNQKNLGKTNELGTDYLQWFYLMECQMLFISAHGSVERA
jgi:hypothetical protein